MEKRRVYIETSVVSYLTARPSHDLIRTAHQQATRDWWDVRQPDCEMFISGLVLSEAAAGDERAAQERLKAIEGLPILPITDEITQLAEALVREGPLPETAADDAFHLAIAAFHGMDILLTWNCAHLANPSLILPVADFLRAKGFSPPIVCTPEMLAGE